MNGQPRPDNRQPSRQLAAEAIHGAQRLVSLEIALAKQELREIATANIIAAACMAVAALFAILVLFVAVPALVVILVPWHWQAALAWAVGYGVAAGALALYGKSRLSLRLPTKTLESLKENKEWALRQMRSARR